MDFAKPFDEDDESRSPPAASGAGAGGGGTAVSAATAAKQKQFLSVAFVQKVTMGCISWFRVLLEYQVPKGGRFAEDDVGKPLWGFYKACLMEGEEELQAVQRALLQCVGRVARENRTWRQLPKDSIDTMFEKARRSPPDLFFLQQTSKRTLFAVMPLPDHEVRSTKPYMAPADKFRAGQMVWAMESELVDHEALGAANVYGVPVCPFSIQSWQMLPVKARFATSTPPLVLYHGTGASAVASILRSGLKPGPGSDRAMLGPGIYLARWNKAKDFANHTVDNIERVEPGAVLRVAVCAAGGSNTDRFVRTLTAEDICTCGCARAFCDHNGSLGKAFPVVAVPDNAGSATRRAEWCVRRPEMLLVLDGIPVLK